MMLKFLRKYTKAIMWVVAVGVIATFVFWGTATRYGERGSNYAGKLFGKKVSFDEFARSFEEVKALALIRYGENFYKVAKYLDLNSQAWEMLMLVKEAKKLKLKVRDDEVTAAIAAMPVFQRNGKFDQKSYERIIEGLFRINTRDFEETMRNTLLITKLQEKILTEVKLAPDVIKEEYKRSHEKARASYILIVPKEFEDKVETKEEALLSYYKEHADDFRKPEQAQIEFIGLEFSKLSESVKLTDESGAKRSLPEGDELKKHAKKIAEDISVELVEDPNFEATAKKYNASHGISGFFAREEPISEIGYSPELADAAFELKENEISDPINTHKGYYIIRLKAKKPSFIPKYEEIKENVMRSYIEGRAESLAKEKASEILAIIKGKPDFSAAAAELGLEVKKTNLFSRGEYIEGLGATDELTEATFSVKVSEIAGPAKTPKGYAILRLDEYVPMDEEAFNKEKENFEKELLARKQIEHFASWFNDLKRRADLTSYIK